MRLLARVGLLVLLAAGGCSPLQSSTTATIARTAPAAGALDAEAAMPAGFPADFPIYPRARLTAAASFASSGQVVWGMEWETLDAVAKVQAFYTKQLSQGDWSLASAPTTTGGFAGTFSRVSNKNVHGTVAAGIDGSVTKILVSLAGPA